MTCMLGWFQDNCMQVCYSSLQRIALWHIGQGRQKWGDKNKERKQSGSCKRSPCEITSLLLDLLFGLKAILNQKIIHSHIEYPLLALFCVSKKKPKLLVQSTLKIFLARYHGLAVDWLCSQIKAADWSIVPKYFFSPFLQ